VGSDGTVYVGSWSNKLYALNPANGAKKWAFTTGDWVISCPAIGKDGTIYVGSYDKKLYAIRPGGTKKWAFSTGGWIHGSPVIAPDGTVYVGSQDNKLYAIESVSLGLTKSAWPAFRHDKMHTGFSKTVIGAPPFSLDTEDQSSGDVNVPTDFQDSQ
jgi:hypothetical protein